jgi:hypothetical protein
MSARRTAIAVLGLGLLATFSLASAGLSAPEPARGSTHLGQPKQYAVGQGPALVAGYRSARFGMTVDEVRAAAAKDFGADVELRPERVELGFTALALMAPTLAAPTPKAKIVPTISYVFREGRLTIVNLTWVTRDPASPDDRKALVDLAAETTAICLGPSWKPLAALRGKVVGNNAVVVFDASDDLGNGVMILLAGVEFDAERDDHSHYRSPSARGPATLRVAFAEDIDHRFDLNPGDF